jgi:hypothetical protein
MVQTTPPDGIGAVGSGMAQFFHPSMRIREKWLNEDKRRLTGVLVTGEGKRRVNRKEHMCYLIRINDFNDGTVFQVVNKNFRIDTAPAQPFPSKAPVQAPAATPGDGVNPDRSSTCNTMANIEGSLLRTATREEIEQLCQQSITVNDDNEPAPENAQAPEPAEASPPGTWEKPQYYCHHLNSDFSDQAGKFVHHQWDEIANMESSNCSACASPRSGLLIQSSHRPTRLWARSTSKSFTFGWDVSSLCPASSALRIVISGG